MGHSLGAQVILSTIHSLVKNPKNKGIIESVHFFGGSIPADSMKPLVHGNEFQKIVNKKIINHYSPYDDVLKAAHDEKWVESPIGIVVHLELLVENIFQNKYVHKTIDLQAMQKQ